MRVRLPVTFFCFLCSASLSYGDDAIVTNDEKFAIDVSTVDGRIAMDLRGDIWTLPAAGGQATRLTDGDLTETRPRWSPDGVEILYEVKSPDGSELWLLDTSTNASAKIGSGDFHNQDASWHPSGEKIVFASDRHGTGLDIWELDLPTGLAWRITDHAGEDREPVWTKDGRHLAWIRKTEDTYALMLRRHGEPEVVLLESGSPLSSPSWRPDNSLLTYLRHGEEGTILEMAILSEPVLVRPLSVDEELIAAPVSWADRMTMFYTADKAIRTRGFEERRSRPLHFRAFIPPVEAKPPEEVVRRELEVLNPPEDRLVIRGARLFDGIWKGYRQNMDVVIEGGRVVAVEARQEWEGDTILDLGDVSIIPGLIDAWSGVEDSSTAGAALLAYGVTTIVVNTEISAFPPSLWEGEAMPGPRLLFTTDDSARSTTSIADSATAGVASLMASRQAIALDQSSRPARRFAETPSLGNMPSPIVAGSKPNRMPSGLALHAELRGLAAAGLDGEQILHAAGKNSARALGLENQVGTITPGGLADLVLVRGDPLGNIEDTLNIVAVVRNGRFFSLVSLLERAQTAANVE